MRLKAEQVLNGLVCHTQDFGLGLVRSGESLEVFLKGSNMIRKMILDAVWIGKIGRGGQEICSCCYDAEREMRA